MAGLQEVAQAQLDASMLEWITERVLDEIARHEVPEPAALTFLLRRYGATHRDDLRDSLEPALDRSAAALSRLESSRDGAGWLTVFAEAAAMSDSASLREAAAGVMSQLRREWRKAATVDGGMRSIAACLAAVNVCDPREMIPEAVDELERIVGAAYQPGDGMAHETGARPFTRGSLSDQVHAALALLAAHLVTDRLPYAMLAEELMQGARRRWWVEEGGGFLPARPFAVNCDAALVLCRLAALHRDAGYRSAAVVAPGADYAADAERTLAWQAPTLADRGLDAALFGLALDELLCLR